MKKFLKSRIAIEIILRKEKQQEQEIKSSIGYLIYGYFIQEPPRTTEKYNYYYYY